MSGDLPPDSPSEKKKPRPKRSQLRVVLDTNALYVTPTSIGSASDLVREEIAAVITDARYPDLDILWYLPEIVRHERQYQMQTEALKLRPAIKKIERLLDHNLALTDQLLVDHVRTRIEEKERQLGLQEIKLDHSLVDWPTLIHASAYRIPPFESGEKEKGFRDALVAESFLQLQAASPKTPSLCRVVLVTSDSLLSRAVKERIADSSNASVLANVEELKGLINTIVSNVGEDFIALIKPKAGKLFFVSSDNKETVFYKDKVRERLNDKFKAELEAKPQGISFRENGSWHIHQPNFSRKESRRVFWTSRIEIDVELGVLKKEDDPTGTFFLSNPLLSSSPQLTVTPDKLPSYNEITNLYDTNIYDKYNLYNPYAPSNLVTLQGLQSYGLQSYGSEKRVISHKGRDIFEVRWSTEVTMSKELKKPTVEDIAHVELSYQPIL
jgi:hypothetical protein